MSAMNSIEGFHLPSSVVFPRPPRIHLSFVKQSKTLPNVVTAAIPVIKVVMLVQYFTTAGPRPGTGPWHQLYRAARDSPGIDN